MFYRIQFMQYPKEDCTKVAKAYEKIFRTFEECVRMSEILWDSTDHNRYEVHSIIRAL